MNHLWQSTWFAIAAGLLTLAFRKNRAQVRYWLWLVASIKFLLPFSILMSLGSYVEIVPAAQHDLAAPVSVTILQASEPFPDIPIKLAPAVRRHSTNWIPITLASVWTIGFLSIVLMRVRAGLRIRKAIRASAPLDLSSAVEIRSVPGLRRLMEPGVVGWIRPILLLPSDIVESLSPTQLGAVIAHELCHVRRKDNLTSAIHMIVEAIFWFHPLIWWIGARLIEERERACDEEVLRLGNQPRDYADAILNVCKLYVESPLECVSGVTGSDLKKRIEAIMLNRSILNLNFAKKSALAIAAMAAIAMPIIIGIMNAPTLRAQSQAAARPEFEVSSVKPCGPLGSEPPGGGGTAKGGRGGRGTSTNSPDRVSFPCLPLRLLIGNAYVTFADGHIHSPQTDIRLEGGPNWINSERYAINAKAAESVGQEMMQGPMMQRLLEDRFKLKLRHETREMPLYALTVMKGGPKLQAMAPGSCQMIDDTKYPRPRLEPGNRPCGSGPTRMNQNKISMDVYGATMLELARKLNNSGRPVVDKTGIEGRFDFTLTFAPEEGTVRLPPGVELTPLPDGEPPPPSIFTALQEFGLKLEPVKGPREFLVIDHIEKPTEN
jgi:bla regulator protein BlaR1